MIAATVPHKVKPCNVNTIPHKIHITDLSTDTIKYTNYDDSELKRRISILENKVENISGADSSVDIARRVAILEGKIDHYVTKTEFSHLEGRVTTLEDTPVGLSNSQMNEILN